MAHNLNDILIAQFKKAFPLTDRVEHIPQLDEIMTERMRIERGKAVTNDAPDLGIS